MKLTKEQVGKLKGLRGDPKGWRLRNSEGWQQAYSMKDGKYKYAGRSMDYREAVIMAIAGAVQAGSINWRTTRMWLEIANIDVTDEEIVARFGRVKGNGWIKKGWAIWNTTTRGRLRNPLWQARIGPDIKNGTVIGSSAVKKQAVKMALREAVGQPYYGERETVLYLDRIGMQELIPMARAKKRRAA
jgi:hypothetical protein